MKPYSYQKDVINAAIEGKGQGKKIIVKSRRQVGKSLLLSNLLLYFSINYQGSQNYCVSPTLKQAKKLYRQIVDGLAKAKIIKSNNASDLVICFINGSKITFKSAQQRQNLRGETCTGICCIDESAYIEDDVYYELVNPWVDYHKAVTVMVSTPFIKQGFFFKMFQFGREGKFDCVSVDWSDEKYKEDLNKILSPEKLAEYKKVLPANVFKSEYLGEWIDDDGLVFQIPEDCLKDKQISVNDRLYIGIDWSNQGENDDTCISVFNDKGEQVFLRYFNRMSPLKQIDVLFSLIEPWLPQIAVILCETNSIGTPYTDLLKGKSQTLAQKVQGWNTSNTSKNTLVANFQVALEGRQITMLPDEKQKAQFGYFSADYNPRTRNISYAAPQGLNDDLVMATLIAYQGLKEGQSSGHYAIRFAKNNNFKRR